MVKEREVLPSGRCLIPRDVNMIQLAHRYLEFFAVGERNAVNLLLASFIKFNAFLGEKLWINDKPIHEYPLVSKRLFIYTVGNKEWISALFRRFSWLF